MINTLAAVPDARGDHAASEQLLREALAIQHKHLGETALAQGSIGPDHQLTAWLGANLASVLVDRRAFREAEALYADSLDKLRARLGDDHSLVQRVRQRIAEMRKVGGFAESPATSK